MSSTLRLDCMAGPRASCMNNHERGTEDGEEPLPSYLGWPRHNCDTAFIRGELYHGRAQLHRRCEQSLQHGYPNPNTPK
jgi:hypothetical protein